MSRFDLWVHKNKNSILVVGGLILEFAVGNALTVVSTIRAQKAIEKKKADLNVDKLTPKETFQAVGKHMVAPVVVNAVSLGMIAGGYKGTLKDKTLLSTALATATTNALQYKQAVKNSVGPEKEREIARQANTTTKEINSIIIGENSKCKWYEPLTGRYFYATWHDIVHAADELNAKARTATASEITANEWFEALGLKTVSIGDNLIWDLNRGMFIDIVDDADVDENHQPYGVIRYCVMPIGI